MSSMHSSVHEVPPASAVTRDAVHPRSASGRRLHLVVQTSRLRGHTAYFDMPFTNQAPVDIQTSSVKIKAEVKRHTSALKRLALAANIAKVEAGTAINPGAHRPGAPVFLDNIAPIQPNGFLTAAINYPSRLHSVNDVEFIRHFGPLMSVPGDSSPTEMLVVKVVVRQGVKNGLKAGVIGVGALGSLVGFVI